MHLQVVAANCWSKHIYFGSISGNLVENCAARRQNTSSPPTAHKRQLENQLKMDKNGRKKS